MTFFCCVRIIFPARSTEGMCAAAYVPGTHYEDMYAVYVPGADYGYVGVPLYRQQFVRAPILQRPVLLPSRTLWAGEIQSVQAPGHPEDWRDSVFSTSQVS